MSSLDAGTRQSSSPSFISIPAEQCGPAALCWGGGTVPRGPGEAGGHSPQPGLWGGRLLSQRNPVVLADRSIEQTRLLGHCELGSGLGSRGMVWAQCLLVHCWGGQPPPRSSNCLPPPPSMGQEGHKTKPHRHVSGVSTGTLIRAPQLWEGAHLRCDVLSPVPMSTQRQPLGAQGSPGPSLL